MLLTTGHGELAADVLGAALESLSPPTESHRAEILAHLARVEAGLGRYAEARDHALEAERLAEGSGDLRTLATSQRVLSLTYWHLEELDAAAEVGRRGLALSQRIGSAMEIGGSLLNLGLIEESRGNFDEAVAHTQRAIEEFERLHSEGSRAQGYTNLAAQLEEAGRLDEALEYCERAEELARAIGYPIAIAQITDTRAMAELKLGRFAEAAATAEEAARLYLEFGTVPDALGMLQVAADAWRKAGESGRARKCDSQAREMTPA